MKHRGRHRRRRRGAALRAFLAGTALALTAAATMISASQATVTEDPGALRQLTSPAGADAPRLAADPVPRAALDRLSAAMGGPVGVDRVLRGADHTLASADDCTGAQRHALPVAPAATRAYCFTGFPGAPGSPDSPGSPGDDTAAWRPGAVSVSGDGTARVLASAWSRGDAAGVAFVDASDPDHLAYGWALLAVAVDGGRDYRALASPVTGMVWDRDTLLVTAGERDRAALYAFDVRRVLRASVDSAAVGRVPGGWSAAGAPFVLPAVASYRPAGDAHLPGPAGLGLDRSSTPASLAVSERVPAGDERPTRLWRYRLGVDGLPLTDPVSHLTAPDAAYTTKATEVRGVLPYGSRWYVARATGASDGRGMLWRQDPDGSQVARCGADDTRLCWSEAPQSLSYAPGTGELWSQSGGTLFAVPLAAVDSALR